jgi:hypothetical protein
LSIIAFGNPGYPYAIKSIREEKNSLSLRQFFFVFRINFILFGGTQREEGNQDQSQKHVKKTEQKINDLMSSLLLFISKRRSKTKLCLQPEGPHQRGPFSLVVNPNDDQGTELLTARPATGSMSINPIYMESPA